MKKINRVVTLFPKVFYLKHLDIDTKKIVSMIDEHFIKAGTNTECDVDDMLSISSSFFVLNDKKFKNLKNEILKEINNFSQNTMFYKNKFKITTSWFTKTKKNQSSNYHNHNNCMLSGILYLQTEQNSGDISFEDFNNCRYKLNITKYNLYSCSEHRITPSNGLMILFPSEVHHKVLKNKSNSIRYSLAFNAIPIGDIGFGDSFINENNR